MIPGLSLEFDLQRHLPLARYVVGERAEDAAGSARAIDTTVRVGQIGVIQEVEGLGAELRPHAFVDGERLEERHVRLPECRAVNEVAAYGAELSLLRPLTGNDGLAVGGQRSIGSGEPAELAGVAQ